MAQTPEKDPHVSTIVGSVLRKAERQRKADEYASLQIQAINARNKAAAKLNQLDPQGAQRAVKEAVDAAVRLALYRKPDDLK